MSAPLTETPLVSICGVALRAPHYPYFLERKNRFRALEVGTENYLFTEGERRDALLDLARDHVIHLHGVSANLGSFDPLDTDYFKKLAELAEATSARLVSDHLCFTREGGKSTFELLPIPLTWRMVDHLGQRLEAIRDLLGCEFLVENISRYFTYKIDEIGEAEFLAALHERYGARILLDVNNVQVSAANLGFDARAYLESLPGNAVAAYHLGGYEIVEGFPFDTHGAAIAPEVRALFQAARARFGDHPTFLERDENLPVDAGALEDELASLTRGAL